MFSIPHLPNSLRAGPVDLIFDRELAWLRNIRVGEREIIRAIYGAIRDEKWATISPILTSVSVQESAGDGFQIRFTAECRSAEIHFVWEGQITGNGHGEIRFEFDGEAKSAFLRNRIGLCVLFPIDECAGEPCLAEHWNGSHEQTAFPILIAPFQPIQSIRLLRQKIGEGRTLEVHFDGEIFEMEDQRNWTDASFKVYGTPLALPFPVQIKKGEKVRQTATLKLLPNEKHSPRFEGRVRVPRTDNPAIIEVKFDRLRPKPFLGLGLPSSQADLTSASQGWLRALHLDHLRFDCRPWQEDWRGALHLAGEQAAALGTGLNVAIFLEETEVSVLRQVGEAAAALSAPPRLWLIFNRDGSWTPPHFVEQARKILVPSFPNTIFAAGTDANFAELNRRRPPEQADWFPCCSINPQVHTTDILSLVENLAAQADVVTTARSFSSQPLVVSPITLLPRCNAKIRASTKSQTAPPADPRQSSFFAAGWTLGSLAALTAREPVHSLTYYETIGPRGIIAGDSAREVFPAYYAFRGIAEMVSLAEIRFATSRSSLRIAALAGPNKAGRAVVWLANLTAEIVRVRLNTNPRFQFMLLNHVDDRNATAALRDPQKWWRNATAGSSPQSKPDETVELPGYGLVRVELER